MREYGERFGGDIDLREKLDPEFLTRARLHYDERLPFHNDEQSLKSLLPASRIVNARIQEGRECTPRVVAYATYLNDIGYGTPIEGFFESREAHHVYVAEQLLLEAGEDPDFIAEVGFSILATKHNMTSRELQHQGYTGLRLANALITRAADVAGMMGEFDDYVRDNCRIRRENEILQNVEIPWDVFAGRQSGIMGVYFGDDIELTSQYWRVDADGRKVSHWHEMTQANWDAFRRSAYRTPEKLDNLMPRFPQTNQPTRTKRGGLVPIEVARALGKDESALEIWNNKSPKEQDELLWPFKLVFLPSWRIKHGQEVVQGLLAA